MVWEKPLALTSLPGWRTEDFEGFSSLYKKATAVGPSLPKKNPNQTWEEFLKDHFEAHPCSHQGVLTGYYGPTLRGSKTQSEKFSTPLYRLPKSEQNRVLTRKEIHHGNLLGKGLEVCFVENKIEAFFLEIQGSGRIELDSGEHFYATYEGQNGHLSMVK
ncbi:MAG: hypothetical protein GY915_09630 [bacterium]|nr:hypothetical protein [bacterium]